MDNMDFLLKDIPKDDKGYDDLDGFWAVADKLSLPSGFINATSAGTASTNSTKRSGGGRGSAGRGNLTPGSESKKENRKSLSNVTGSSADSDTDFDYDTSSTISEELEEEQLTLPDDDDELTEPENEVPAAVSTTPLKSSVVLDSSMHNRSIPLSPQSASNKSVASTVTTASSRKSFPDSSTLSDSSLLSGSLAFEDSVRQSIESARGRKSSLVTNADSSMLRSNTRRGSVATTPSSKSGLASPPATVDAMDEKSLLLSSVKKSGRQSTESRRVSFGGLSPISMGDAADEESSSPERSVASSSKSSHSRLSEPSQQADSTVDTSMNTTVRSAATPSTVAQQQSMLSNSNNDGSMQSSRADASPSNNSSSFYDNGDDYGGNEDYPDFDEEDQQQPQTPADEDASRLKSMVSTAASSAGQKRSSSSVKSAGTNNRSSLLSSANKSAVTEEDEDENTSRLESSHAYTPKSTASSSSKRRTPASMRSMISTPGSNDFVRGRRISDSSFHIDDAEGSDEEEEDEKAGTDQEEMDTSASMLAHNNKKKKNVMDVSESFIDNSFLGTISSANKKYAGKKVLAETKHLHKEQKAKKATRAKKRLGLSDDEMSVETESDNSEDGDGVRRSRRATKGRRFAFWKGERPLYQEGTMVGLMQVEPTPVKPKKGQQQLKRKRGENSERLHVVKLSKKEEKLPEIELSDDVDYLDPAVHEVLNIWDNYHEKVSRSQVLCCADTMGAPQPLPTTAHRPPGKNKCGFASHLLSVPEVKGQMPAWTSGYIDLPAEAIKDAEGVGKYTQLYFVAEGQPGSLEFALADPSDDVWVDETAQRVLLGPGDSFYVPPGNIYRLENHSKVKACKLYWVVVMPIAEPDEFAGSSVSEGTVVSGVSYQ